MNEPNKYEYVSETKRTRAGYGDVKQALIEGQERGLTYAEVSAKHGIRRPSLYIAAKRLGISLKPSKHTK